MGLGFLVQVGFFMGSKMAVSWIEQCHGFRWWKEIPLVKRFTPGWGYNEVSFVGSGFPLLLNL